LQAQDQGGRRIEFVTLARRERSGGIPIVGHFVVLATRRIKRQRTHPVCEVLPAQVGDLFLIGLGLADSVIEDVDIQPGDLSAPGPVLLPGGNDGVFDETLLDVVARKEAGATGISPVLERLRVFIK
jgi:hypothetical protein